MHGFLLSSLLPRFLSVLTIAWSLAAHADAQQVSMDCKFSMQEQIDVETSEDAYAYSIALVAEMDSQTPVDIAEVLCVRLERRNEKAHVGRRWLNFRRGNELFHVLVGVSLYKESDWSYISIKVGDPRGREYDRVAPCILSKKISERLVKPWKSVIKVDSIHKFEHRTLAWSTEKETRVISPDVREMEAKCIRSIGIEIKNTQLDK